jgi:hypothetical protein
MRGKIIVRMRETAISTSEGTRTEIWTEKKTGTEIETKIVTGHHPSREIIAIMEEKERKAGTVTGHHMM